MLQPLDTGMLNAAGVVALLTLVVNIFVQQVVKPIFEATPLGQPVDSAAHDAFLRGFVFVLNGALIYLASQTVPQLMGTPWYELVGWTFGQTALNHVAFKWSQQPPPPQYEEPPAAPYYQPQPQPQSQQQATYSAPAQAFGIGSSTYNPAQTQAALPAVPGMPPVSRPPGTTTRPFRTVRDVNLPQQPGEPPAWLTGAPQSPPAPSPGAGDASAGSQGQPPEAGR